MCDETLPIVNKQKHPKKGEYKVQKEGPMCDETLPIINKPKHPKRGNTRNKNKGPTSKKTKEQPKRANHKGNIKFPNSLLSRQAYQIGKGEDFLKGCLD
jgi:hypothetical protein